MEIKGLEGMSNEKINYELQRGGKFVVYEYCISIILMTFKRPSRIHFITADQSRFLHGLTYTLITLALGWWGIPWGPIYSLGSLFTNLSGGKDVTADILAAANSAASG